MYHYVYRITNIIENKHYYGVRSSQKIPTNDLGIKYYSSSTDEDFINEQKNNPENFKYKIIKIFNNRKEAIKLEIKLHNKFNVGVNKSFYNKTKQTSIGFDTTGTSRKHSINTIHKIKIKRASQTFSAEDKVKMSISAKNRKYSYIYGFYKDNILLFTLETYELKEYFKEYKVSYQALLKSAKNNTSIYSTQNGSGVKSYSIFRDIKVRKINNINRKHKEYKEVKRILNGN